MKLPDKRLYVNVVIVQFASPDEVFRTKLDIFSSCSRNTFYLCVVKRGDLYASFNGLRIFIRHLDNFAKFWCFSNKTFRNLP